MDYDALKAHSDTYPRAEAADLTALASGYKRRQESEVLELAAIAADVSVDTLVDLELNPEANPLLEEALRRQYPNVDPESLAGASAERLEGLVRGVKGKYFEVLVRDRLNAEGHVGEIQLREGLEARLADSSTQRGWDLEIVDTSDGSTVEVLQLKATTSLSLVKQALEEYPDIKVAVPSDVEAIADQMVRTDIADEHLQEAAEAHVGELGETVTQQALEEATEWAFDSVPLVPAILVGITEGRAVLAGRSSLQDAVSRGAARVGRSGLFTTLGATLTALDAGILSVPTSVGARLAWQRIANQIEMGHLLQAKTEETAILTRA